jgi:hypothetical protein
LKPRANKRAALLAIVALLALMAGGAVWWLANSQTPDAKLVSVTRARLGLMSTLPIYWGEAAGIEEMLQSDSEPPWVRRRLERHYEIVPLDTLEQLQASDLDRLLLAQPRALSGAENVALDEWVRGGGNLLLFADPMLTGDYRFAIGDRRRPQDVILLSPILARWGLGLEYDPGQMASEYMAEAVGTALPVNQAGRFLLAPDASDAPGDCTLSGGGLAARCRIGDGQVLLIADAAMLDDAQGDEFDLRLAALDTLSDEAFGR